MKHRIVRLAIVGRKIALIRLRAAIPVTRKGKQ
jgi:hypothetical protein